MSAASRLEDRLATLLRYPDEGYHDSAAECRTRVSDCDHAVRDRLAAFERGIEGLPLFRLQERFTETFDLDPVCTLDVGWHLYGEAYERGRFLAEMREALQQAGVVESIELPDHLSHLLPLMGRLDDASAATLAQRIVPALEKIEASLDGQENPFEPLLRAVHAVVNRHAPEVVTRD